MKQMSAKPECIQAFRDRTLTITDACKTCECRGMCPYMMLLKAVLDAEDEEIIE